MKDYQAPALQVIGTVAELTAQTKPDKCGGSGDQFLPTQLSSRFGTPRC